MKAHDWRLALTLATPAYRELTWRCDDCLTKVLTRAPAGPEDAEDYKPGSKALQDRTVLEDCDDCLVDGVHGL